MISENYYEALYNDYSTLTNYSIQNTKKENAEKVENIESIKYM